MLATDGLILRLDANSLSSLEDGDSVTLWGDSSGEGNDASHTTGTAPVYRSRGFNGRPCVSFNGTQQTLQGGFTEEYETPGTMLAVLNMKKQGVLFDTTNRNIYTIVHWATNQTRLWGGSQFVAQSQMPPGRYLLTTEYNSTQSKVYIDGFHKETGNTGTSGPLGSSFRINDDFGGYNARMEGDIAELVLYDRVLTPQELEDAHRHLMVKWGLLPPVTDGLHSMFDAQRFRTTTAKAIDGDPVDGWFDNVGEYTATKTAPGNAAEYLAHGLNGKPTIRFEGNAHLQTDQFATALSQPNTIFVVAKYNVTDDWRYFIDGRDTNNRHLVSTASSGNYVLWAGSESRSNRSADTLPHVHTWVYQTASSTIRIDGEQIHSGNPGTNSLSGLTIGGRFNENRLDGDISEVLLFDRALSETEILQVEKYLTDKWMNKVPVVDGLVMHLDATDLSHLPGEAIDIWPDKSLKANHSIGNGPVLFSNVQKGLPSVFFDGVDDMFETIEDMDLTQDGGTFFFVSRMNRWKNWNGMLGITTNIDALISETEIYWQRGSESNGNAALVANRQQSGQSSHISSGVSPGFGHHLHIWGVVISDTASRFRLVNQDGVYRDVTSNGDRRPNNPGKGYVGAGYYQARLHGHMTEVLVFDRALSEQEILDVEDYLLRKWWESVGGFPLANGLYAPVYLKNGLQPALHSVAGQI